MVGAAGQGGVQHKNHRQQGRNEATFLDRSIFCSCHLHLEKRNTYRTYKYHIHPNLEIPHLPTIQKTWTCHFCSQHLFSPGVPLLLVTSKGWRRNCARVGSSCPMAWHRAFARSSGSWRSIGLSIPNLFWSKRNCERQPHFMTKSIGKWVMNVHELTSSSCLAAIRQKGVSLISPLKKGHPRAIQKSQTPILGHFPMFVASFSLKGHRLTGCGASVAITAP